MKEDNPIKRATAIIGIYKLAKAVGLTYQAVLKWEKAGMLPRTEWTGETNYSTVIERLTDGKVTRGDLLRSRASKVA